VRDSGLEPLTHTVLVTGSDNVANQQPLHQPSALAWLRRVM
jgi:hypothetical protein